MRSETPYNPLDKKNLGISVADALLEKPVEPLPPSETFAGAGIYAIYYIGAYGPYERIASQNRKGQFAFPIYVGKAVPPGARKGDLGLDTPAGTVLFRRLCEHADSIKQAQNLDIDDFFCRYLVVDDIWIPLGESLLIKKFLPIWNTVIDGFGNHDPGSGRHNQRRSPWDVLHPGRHWADSLKGKAKTEKQILETLQIFLTQKEDPSAY